MNEGIDDRLRAALLTGGDAALMDWASTGLPGLLRLREYLAGHFDPAGLEGIHSRDLVDNTSAVVAAIAAAHPQAFLEVFEGDRFEGDSYVLTGLGRIDDPRATDRLARASASKDWVVRMEVAIGLGRRPSTLATETLGRLVDDDDYLVRYHALRSLGRIGDASVLPVLRGLVSRTSHEAQLVADAIESITARAADHGANG